MDKAKDSELEKWRVAAIKKGIAAADRGDLVPHEEVKAWAVSLGSSRELPRPRVK